MNCRRRPARCPTARSPPSPTSPPAPRTRPCASSANSTPTDPLSSLDEVRPRLDRAEAWINTQVPADQRTVVRKEADTELIKSLDDQGRASLRLLLDGLDSHWSLDGLTHLVYGVPKVQAGFSADATPKELPAEIKVAQRTFFALLYHLLVGRDTGPRLPTLLLAVGQERVRKLLGE